MDLIERSKEKVSFFRIKELKGVLSQLGLAKQGKKQILQEKVLALLSDEQVPISQVWGRRGPISKEKVANIIEDTYRKMQVSGATDLASNSHSGSDLSNMKHKEEVVDSYQTELKVRCLCGSSLVTQSMIQCEDPKCSVWQHIACVLIPDKPMNGASPEIPPHFYCEICRVSKADPFWVTISHPLLPLKLSPSVITGDGTNMASNMERTFQLPRADKEMLQKAEYDVQVLLSSTSIHGFPNKAWCLLLNDKVQFRMQWPQYSDLRINGVVLRVVNRPGSQILGINGRDDGVLITTSSREGDNKVILSSCDARIFCFGIRLVKRRTVQEVLSLVPKEEDGEHFDDALAHVCRCSGGGSASENAGNDSDSDVEVVSDSITVNLRCPMSGSRIKIAGRFRPCIHMGCFDLEAFVELNQRARKWQCPICLKNYTLENIIIDPYFNRITSMLQNCGEDVNEIEVRPDGSWRAKNVTELRDLAKWHLPNGSLCPTIIPDVKSVLESSREIKQEGLAEDHRSLKLGIKRNRFGVWEVSKSSGFIPKFANDCNIMPRSGSATGSFRVDEDPSVNQEIGVDLNTSNNVHELDSFSLDLDPPYDAEDRNHPQYLKDPDVILLSDSDEDNHVLISPDTVYDTCAADCNGVQLSSLPVVSERFAEEPGLGTSGTSLGFFSNNTDNYEMPIWPMQTCHQIEPGFQFFGTEVDIPDALADSHSSLGCVPVSSYGLTTNNELGDNLNIHGLSVCHPTGEMHGSLVDNPLAFDNDDPSLQIFLPSQPNGVHLQTNLNDRADVTNAINPDDWASLRLAAGACASESAPPDRHSSLLHFPSKESGIEPKEKDASLFLSIGESEAVNANRETKRLNNSWPQAKQPRLVKPRLYLSFNSDSN